MSRRSYRDRQAPSASGDHIVLQIACQLAIRFVQREPTVEELQADYGMSRATAFRWRGAIRAARGNLGNGKQDQHKGNDNG